MATNEKIKLDITSAFDPGGFSKANRAVRELGGEMKKGGKVANELMGAFGSANGAIGDVASSVSKLGAAFKGGGWVALAVAGVALLVAKFFEAKEAAAKLAEEQRKMWSEQLIKKTETSLTILKSRHAQIADEIERGAKAADKIAKSYEALAKSEISASNAEADKTVALLEGGKQSALSAEEDPVKRKAIELDYERKIFEAKKESAQFERDQKKSMAGEKVSEAESALAAEKSKLASLRSRAKELADWMSTRTGESKTRLYGQAKSELDSTRGSMKDTESSIREKSLGLSSARNEQRAAMDADQAAMTREAIAQGEMADKQAAFEKAQAEYQNNLDRRLKVEQLIARQEAKIADAKDKEAARETKRAEWKAQADKARQLGAGGWNRAKAAEAESTLAVGKDSKNEAEWVAGAKRRMSTGAKLSKKDMDRIANFGEWQKLQGANPFNPAKAAADQAKAQAENLAELKKLNTNLENSLKVN